MVWSTIILTRIFFAVRALGTSCRPVRVSALRAARGTPTTTMPTTAGTSHAYNMRTNDYLENMDEEALVRKTDDIFTEMKILIDQECWISRSRPKKTHRVGQSIFLRLHRNGRLVHGFVTCCILVPSLTPTELEVHNREILMHSSGFFLES